VGLAAAPGAQNSVPEDPHLLSASPFLPKTSDRRSVLHNRVRVPGESDIITLIPDGVCALGHNELGKTVLFFVEIDMGTEARTSAAQYPGEIRRKLQCYQQLLSTGDYRRYETDFDAKFRGFRLLMVTPQPERLRALCRLVREVCTTDFVWLTDRSGLLRQGIHAPIWRVGGREDLPPQSILGSEASHVEAQLAKANSSAQEETEENDPIHTPADFPPTAPPDETRSNDQNEAPVEEIPFREDEVNDK
jgi:hypothetical protein